MEQTLALTRNALSMATKGLEAVEENYVRDLGQSKFTKLIFKSKKF